MRKKNGYEVIRVLVFWNDNHNREVAFNKFSSPVNDTVAAGNYYIWCRRAVGKQYIDGTKKLVMLNNVPKDPVEISLPAEDMIP